MIASYIYINPCKSKEGKERGRNIDERGGNLGTLGSRK